MNAIDKPDTRAVATTGDAGSIMAVIARAASDPQTDVAKIERLTDLYLRIRAQEARAAYMAALSAMQPDLPVIERRGRIIIKAKNDENKVLQSTPYALWDDINEAIKPLLKQHHFTLSFRTGVATDGKITVTGILGHAEGHQEETTVTLPHDSSGSKNAVQAVGSSTSYGKRYAAGALLNLTFKDEDDDGVAGGTAYVTDKQIADLQELIVETGADLPRFLKHFGVSKLIDLPAADYPKALHMLQEKARVAAKGATVA